MRNPFKWENFKFVSDIKPPSPENGSYSSNLKNSPLLKKKNPLNKRDLINTRPKTEKLLSPSIQKQKKFKRSLTLAVVAFLVVGAIMVFSSLYSYRQEVVRSLSDNIENFRTETENFSLIRGFKSDSNSPPPSVLKETPARSVAASFWPVLKESINTYKDFQSLSSEANSLFTEVSGFVETLPNLIFKQKGPELITKLETINQSLKSLIQKNSSLGSRISNLKDFSGSSFDFYLPLQSDLNRYQAFLESLIVWLKSEGNHYLLVLFLNPSEMRPGGGFLGSYAVVALNQGNVLSIDVKDINDLDRGFTGKIIPPKPVQAIASRWKAADSNWFFDFPSSARVTLQFAEGSALYKDANITFDGVLALSANTISDLLKITGPVDLADQKVSLTSDEFIYEIQKDIQTGRASGESYPKKILQDATPLILEKISNLDSTQKSQLFSYFLNWLKAKDFMIYFKDPEFQQIFSSLNVSGEVYEIPNNFSGDYLAVVNANLGGGKTDIFIDQNISLQSQLNDDGTVSNKLKITRDHTGDEAKSSWYRVPNQNYLTVFTLKDARLDDFSGGVAKTIKASINYKAAGYLTDPLISEIESTEKDFLTFPNLKTYQAFGKNLFAFWTKTDLGKKSEISLEYTNRLPNPLQVGQTYQFIFERQAGASGSYKFDISAPIGFVWKENNLPIYEYVSKDPPGRLIIPLTLKETD